MKYIISLLLILSLFAGCKTARRVSVSQSKAEAVMVTNEQQRAFVKVDSSVQIMGVDSYNIVTIVEYKTDSSGKTAPIKKTIKKSGIKHQLNKSEHSTVAAKEMIKANSATVKNESYTKNKDVKRNSNMTGIIIAVIAVSVFLIIKMIRK